MFKKINDILISKYPLLWNTKAVFVIPLAIIIHLLFYLAGFIYPISIDELWQYYHFKEDSVVMLSVLISALFIIIWLVFYLRNNPFKSFYTLGRGYMFKEFVLIFTVFFSSATFFLSYKQGLYDNVDLKTNDINLIEESKVVNLSAHFIAFDYSDFNANGCCDSIEARRVRDSIETEYEKTLTPTERREYSRRKQAERDAAREKAKMIDDPHSYLHYCKLEVEFYNTIKEGHLLNEVELNKIAHDWLKKGKKDSLQQLFVRLLAICDTYGVTYNFNPKDQVKECFNDSAFTVRNTLYRYYVDSTDYRREYDYDEYNDDYDEQVRNYLKTYSFIEMGNLKDALQQIDSVRNGFWNIILFIVWIYYALGMTILLFSFRVTRLKHWFLSLIGIGLWAILLALIGVGLGLNKEFPMLLVFIWMLIFVIGVVQIVNRKKKLLAGIAYNWILWFMPFVLPLIFVFIDSTTNKDCYKAELKETINCQINHWIDTHWVLINSVNIALVIVLVFFVFIPLVRKWQSNPDE